MLLLVWDMKFILSLFKRFNFFNKTFKQAPMQALTKEDLTLFAKQINDICDTVEEKNLTLVSNLIESTSGHNNYNLVKAAVYFVKECVWVFNSEYANEYVKTNYMNEFINYLREVQHEFEQHHHDPDGVGGGTITDIVNQIDRQTTAE